MAGGTKEGEVDVLDLPALRIPLLRLRPHLSSIHTLALESLAEQAPAVSFVHVFPGAVHTDLHKDTPGWLGWFSRIVHEIVYALSGRWLFVPIEECGDRHVYLATNGRYKPKDGDAVGVKFIDGVDAAKGTDGVEGSGVYSLDWDCEGSTKNSVEVLDGLRKKGTREAVWNHITEEFERVVGTSVYNRS